MTEKKAQIEAVRSAVDKGIDAIARGAYKEFASSAALADYLRSRRTSQRP
jgi:hypothetical protein